MPNLRLAIRANSKEVDQIHQPHKQRPREVENNEKYKNKFQHVGLDATPNPMKKLLLFLLAFLTFGMPRVAEAQVTVAPFLTSNPQFLDGSGSPLNSGCVFTYAAGTTTPLVTYSDSAGSTPNSNPVILNSGGFPQAGGIWLTSAAYKFVVKSTGGSNCSTGSTITTTDGITWATPAQTFSGITSTANVVINPATAATGGANQSSPTLCIQGFYFNVTSLTDQWCLSDVLGSGAAPTATFTLTHSGSSGAATWLVPGNTAFGQSDSTGYIISAKDLTSTTLSTLHISHHATLSGAYGLEIHNYNSCGLDCLGVAPTAGVGATNAFVVHQYSQVVGGAAVQLDNTGPSTILVLKNAVNSTTSFGTIGTGDFIDWVGFSTGSPGTPVTLGHLSNNLQFGTDDSTTTWTFGDGVAALSGVGGSRSALAVTSANGTHAAVTISNSVSNLYAETLNSQNFGDNITCATNSGECLHVEKDGVGAGTGVNIVNKGSGNSIQATDGTTTKFSVDSTGKAAIYNSITTVGNGLTATLSQDDKTAQSASIGTITLLTGGAATTGHYVIGFATHITTADASGASYVLTVNWTEDGIARSSATSSAAFASTANGQAGALYMNPDNSTNVTYSTTVTGAPTTGRYAVHIWLVKQ